MTKWQYKVLFGGIIFKNGNRIVVHKEENLNKEGEDGWELVSVTRESSSDFIIDVASCATRWVYFKTQSLRYPHKIFREFNRVN
jgi:hypothetical protein